MSYVKQPISFSQFKRKELICPICLKRPTGLTIIKIEGLPHLHPRHVHNNIQHHILQFVHKNCKAEYFKILSQKNQLEKEA